MWSRSELKANAKVALKKFYWKSLLALLIIGAVGVALSAVIGLITQLVTGVSSSDLQSLQNVNLQDGSLEAVTANELPEGYAAAQSLTGLLNLIGQVFLTFPLSVGLLRFFEKSRGIPTGVGELFAPMKKFAHVGLIMLWMGIKVCLWSLLLVVPGIIKAYEYSMVPYLLAENPELSGKRAFQISKAMTKGNKWNLFVLDLSFIPWLIAAVCTCGLGYFWVGPYMQATMTEAYYKLKAGAVANGGLALQEVPDICLPAQQNVVPFDQAAATPDASAAVPVAAATAAAAAASNAVEEAPAAVEAAEEAVAAPVEEAAEVVAAPVEEAAEAVAAPVEEAAEAVVAPVEEAAEAVVAPVEEAVAAPVEEATDAVEGAVEAVEETVDAAAASVEEAADAVAAPVEEAVEAVEKAVDAE